MRLTWRIWLLIIALILSVMAISPTFKSGVMVKSVEKDSIEFAQGLRSGEIITEVNGQPIKTLEDFTAVARTLTPTEQPRRIDLTTDKSSYTLFTNESLQVVVSSVPKTNIRTGLDIQGGARALVQPEEEISDAELQDLIAVSSNRFNVFGISDVQIRGATDFSGNKYMIVEVAGATPSDLEDLIGKQGKFEARIGNQTAFVGGNEDITSVCRNDASCAGIRGCFPAANGGFTCSFAFTIYLSEEAAQRHANITAGIPLDVMGGGQYLAANLSLLVDDVAVDQLLIGRDLKGRATTQISIQGSGSGMTQQEALTAAQESMRKLQTILITGSIPYKLNIAKLDTISPLLGERFTSMILLAGLFAMLAVSIVIFIRYRNIKISLALLATSFSEIVIILGIASLIRWNLDLAAIAGILATIGTGVDQQIVILDEARSERAGSIRERMKRALFVVLAAFATSCAALLPLYWAGAGLFRGFAFTSIIGITAGVLITRPAFADMIKRMGE